MSKPIESDALDRVYRTLGLSGGAGIEGTLLDDGNVSQVLVLNEIIRRSRTSAASTGWFQCVFSNIHPGADSQQSAINPYAAGAAARAPYPVAVPRGFDFWVLGASLRRTAGAGDLTGALLRLSPGAGQSGWGIDSTGAAVVSDLGSPTAFWDTLNTDVGSIAFGQNSVSGDVWVQLGLRIPPGAEDITFDSESVAAATFQCFLTCGLFPEGLGQDIASQ